MRTSQQFKSWDNWHNYVDNCLDKAKNELGTDTLLGAIVSWMGKEELSKALESIGNEYQLSYNLDEYNEDFDEEAETDYSWGFFKRSTRIL